MSCAGQPVSPRGSPRPLGPLPGGQASALLLSDPQFPRLGKLGRPAPLTSWAGLTNTAAVLAKGACAALLAARPMFPLQEA